MRTWTSKTLLTLTLAAPLAMLSACGGGGGGGLFDTPPSTTPGAATAGAPAAIEFVSADPATLTMEGVGQAGLTQTGKVTFKVVDALGTPVPNQSVNFTLSTEAGGTHLSASSGTTGEDGTVSVSVISGSVSTPVRVIATVAGTSFSTQSVQLVITTGVPDQDSFSLSISTFNPEGYDIDGTQADVTVRLADRYNNPVPDGTQVVFTTEGGSIVGSCTTVTGACSVKWTSQNPRPSDGRTTLVAYAVGEESYTEANADGRFGTEDCFDNISNPAGCPFPFKHQDIGEPFRDDNEDGFWQQVEWFFDSSINDGKRNEGDGLFNGWLCDDANRCASNHSINVFGQGVIVMAESSSGLHDTSNQPLPDDSLEISSTNTTTGTVSFKILGATTAQIMPAGTTIQAETTYGTFSNGETTVDVTVPNTNDRNHPANTFTLRGTGQNGSGMITVTVTTPSGQITTHTIQVTETVSP